MIKKHARRNVSDEDESQGRKSDLHGSGPCEVDHSWQAGGLESEIQRQFVVDWIVEFVV